MRKFVRAFVGAVLLLASSSVLARDRFDVDYGRNDNRHYRHADRHRSGAWFGSNRHHHGNPHGGHFGAGHDHFSPRGQGGHHWGW